MDDKLSGSRTSALGKYRNELGLAIAVLMVILITLCFSQAYIKQPWLNAKDILHQTALLGIFALGAGVVIISGGIDLSSGSVIAFSGSICALVMLFFAEPNGSGFVKPDKVSAIGVAVGVFAAIVVGLLVGTAHTWLITVIQLPPFVATLASLVGLRSLAKIMNQAVTKQLGNEMTQVRAESPLFLKLGEWWVALAIFLVIGAMTGLLMNRTIIGRHLYAMGGNEEAAKLSGIRTDRLKWLAYTIGGVTSAVAGVLYTAKISTANPSSLGVGYELNAIAAAVVGGCSLQGGVGLIPGVMLGVLFLRVVIDSVAKVVKAGSDDFEGLIVGFLVVLAGAFNELRSQTAGARKKFFPGALGLATIPVLSILLGSIIFRFRESVRDGFIAGFCILILLGVLAVMERRSASK